MTEIELLYCPTCERESLAETPPCPDGHDACPDRACVECGTALVLDAGLVRLISPSGPVHGLSSGRRNVA